MTKQEAIERLHNLQSIKEDDLSAYIGVWYKGIKDDYDEALDMAIEALTHFNSIKNELNELSCSEEPNRSEPKTSESGSVDSEMPEIESNRTTGGMIYRQDAIDTIQKWRVVYDEDTDLIDMIKALPSAQPEQRWIPCSERLPEDLEEVNVTWVNHDPEPYYNFVKDKPFTATAVYYKEKWYWYSSTCADLLAEYGRNPNQGIDDGIEIIAWMPLPEPYTQE